MLQQERKLYGDYKGMRDVKVKMKPAGEMVVISNLCGVKLQTCFFIMRARNIVSFATVDTLHFFPIFQGWKTSSS